MEKLPKVGQTAFAEYVIDGKVKKLVNLGTVIKATNRSFTCEKDGLKTERNYSFGASNGLRLKGFEGEVAEPKPKQAARKKSATKKK